MESGAAEQPFAAAALSLSIAEKRPRLEGGVKQEAKYWHPLAAAWTRVLNHVAVVKKWTRTVAKNATLCLVLLLASRPANTSWGHLSFVSMHFIVKLA